jgi:hypothetical protein
MEAKVRNSLQATSRGKAPSPVSGSVVERDRSANRWLHWMIFDFAWINSPAKRYSKIGRWRRAFH